MILQEVDLLLLNQFVYFLNKELVRKYLADQSESFLFTQIKLNWLNSKRNSDIFAQSVRSAPFSVCFYY